MKRTLLFVLGCLLCSTPVRGRGWCGDLPEEMQDLPQRCGFRRTMAKMGGPLDGVGGKRDQAWLAEFLKNPKSKEPDIKMPALRLTDEERDAVIEYLLSLK